MGSFRASLAGQAARRRKGMGSQGAVVDCRHRSGRWWHMTSTRIEPRDRTLTVDGLKLHVVNWGTEGKPPFVLLHGFSSQARYWDGFAVRMREDYHVYAVDQRGHGQ